jgi:hypothetical protein
MGLYDNSSSCFVSNLVLSHSSLLCMIEVSNYGISLSKMHKFSAIYNLFKTFVIFPPRHMFKPLDVLGLQTFNFRISTLYARFKFHFH